MDKLTPVINAEVTNFQLINMKFNSTTMILNDTDEIPSFVFDYLKKCRGLRVKGNVVLRKVIIISSNIDKWQDFQDEILRRVPARLRENYKFYRDYSDTMIDDFIREQKYRCRKMINPHIILILDKCLINWQTDTHIEKLIMNNHNLRIALFVLVDEMPRLSHMIRNNIDYFVLYPVPNIGYSHYKGKTKYTDYEFEITCDLCTTLNCIDESQKENVALIELFIDYHMHTINHNDCMIINTITKTTDSFQYKTRAMHGYNPTYYHLYDNVIQELIYLS